MIYTYKQLKKDFNKIDINKVKKFISFLLKKNETMNLTAIKKKDMLEKHIYDSLLITKVFDFSNKCILDVGSGGGFPGIPLAILYKNANFTLIDSINKKAKYLEEAINYLELKNVKVICNRVEKINNKYDVIISRALAKLNKIILLTKHLINSNNILITLKGKNAFCELDDSKKILKKENIDLKLVQNENLPNNDKRINFIFKKIK